MFPVHFQSTDTLMAHLDGVFASLRDPFIESRYTGLLAVSAVTALESAVKQIFLDFARAKHAVLGNYVGARFEKLNGKISLPDLKGVYVKPFGVKYLNRFAKRVEAREREILLSAHTSMIQGYDNLITWRHGFVHGGQFPPNATYAEVKKNYRLGKEVLDCLAGSMKR